MSSSATGVRSWVLVVFLEEDVLSHPIPLEEVEDASGRNGVEADLQEKQECRARCSVGDRMLRAVIIRRSENREELVNYYTSVMKLEREEHTADSNNKLWQYTKMIGGSVVVGGLAVTAAPLALSAAGFSSGGIVAGSLAARLMSMAAIANGGGVVAASAGGLIASLQSAGVAGLSATTNLLLGSTAGGVFAMFNRKKPSEDQNETSATKTTDDNQAQNTDHPSEDTDQVRDSDCPSEDTIQVGDSDCPSEDTIQVRDSDCPSEDTIQVGDSDCPSEDTIQVRDSDCLSEDTIQVRDSDCPSEDTIQVRDSDCPSEDTIQVRDSDCPSEDTAEVEDFGCLLDSNTQSQEEDLSAGIQYLSLNEETERLYRENLRLQEANQLV